MKKANTCGTKINRTKDTLGVKGHKTGGSTDAYLSISNGKKFATKNGGGKNGAANKYIK
jgi:hypothetical protein